MKKLDFKAFVECQLYIFEGLLIELEIDLKSPSRNKYRVCFSNFKSKRDEEVKWIMKSHVIKTTYFYFTMVINDF